MTDLIHQSAALIIDHAKRFEAMSQYHARLGLSEHADDYMRMARRAQQMADRLMAAAKEPV